MREIEIICVDDGSTDASSELLARYKESDERVKVLRQQNMYAGVARNRGFEEATGEYVIFLDADDFFEPTLLEKTYNKAKAMGDVDIVLFGAKKYNTRTGEYIEAKQYFRRDLLPDKQVFSRKDMPDDFLRITSPCPWTKLFRRGFVDEENIRFQALRNSNSNDVFFVLVALSVAKTVTYVNEELVYYRICQTGNLQIKKNDCPTVFFEAYEAVYDELNRRGIYKEVEKASQT